MLMVIMKKSKEKRKRIRKWLKTPEGQLWLKNAIKHKQQYKAEQRRKKSLAIMADYHSCKDCFHRLSKSCKDDMPNGCIEWYDGDRSFQDEHNQEFKNAKKLNHPKMKGNRL